MQLTNCSAFILFLLAVQCTLAYSARQTDKNDQQLIILSSNSSTQEPATRVSFDQSFLSEAVAELEPIMEDVMLHAPIPDMSGQVHVALVGKVDWWVSNVDVKNISLHNMQMQLVPNQGIRITVTDGSGEFSADWKWKRESGLLLHPSGHGSADISFKRANINILLVLNETNERLQVQATQVDIDLGHLSIKVKSPWTGWLLDFFLWLFNGIVKHNIESDVAKAYSFVVDDFSNLLQELPIFVSFGKKIEYGLGMLQPPAITSQQLSLDFDGGFYNKKYADESPFAAVAMPLNCSTDMINVLESEFVFNSLGYALFNASLLQYTLTALNVPPKLSDVLNTTHWTKIIPSLPKHYPNAAMDLKFLAATIPTMNISTDGLSGEANALVEYLVIQSNGTTDLNNVLTLGVKMKFTIDAFVKQNATNFKNYLHIKLSKVDFVLSVQMSKIGRVDVVLINTSMRSFIDVILVPAINRILDTNGIPLPATNYMKLVNPVIKYYQQYMCIASSILLNLPLNS